LSAQTSASLYGPDGRKQERAAIVSTIAAASFLGFPSVGLEIDPEYFQLATRAIPLLAQMEQMK
jgi:hypothetical protein